MTTMRGDAERGRPGSGGWAPRRSGELSAAERLSLDQLRGRQLERLRGPSGTPMPTCPSTAGRPTRPLQR